MLIKYLMERKVRNFSEKEEHEYDYDNLSQTTFKTNEKIINKNYKNG